LVGPGALHGNAILLPGVNLNAPPASTVGSEDLDVLVDLDIGIQFRQNNVPVGPAYNGINRSVRVYRTDARTKAWSMK
jgi:hypothetical protein